MTCSENKPNELRKRKFIEFQIPKEKGVEGVITFMKNNEKDADMQVDAFKVLLEMNSKKVAQFSQADKKLLAELMRKHISRADVQIFGCRLLAILATDGKCKPC